MGVQVAYTDHRTISAATPVPGERGTADAVMLGIGNLLLGDDGVGIRLVERLRDNPSFAGVSFVDGGTLSFSLLDLIENANALLVADAAELGEPAGTIRVFEDEAMDRFLASSRRRSVHEVGLCDLLDMARLRDCLPGKRALLCVQPQTIGWNESLSDPVSGAMSAALEQAGHLLHAWGLGS